MFYFFIASDPADLAVEFFEHNPTTLFSENRNLDLLWESWVKNHNVGKE